MLRCPGLPILPGTSFRDITKSRYHKSHHWDTLNGIPILAESKRCGIGGAQLVDPDGPPHYYPSLYPPYEGPKLPPWIVYDGKVLCFNAYFKETLHEVYRAPYQVRKVKILFYLEDGTVQVSEPRIDNSGLSQGCIVSRQRVPRPPPCQHEFLSCLDLNVNQTIKIFDRVYHITDCDLFTRHFLNRMGVSISDPVHTPIDPGMELRKKSLEQTKKAISHIDTLGKFIENDRKILKFNSYWDDRKTMFGDVRELIIYYFLADDTIQIKEIFPKNSGRDAPGIFLRRQKIPKEWKELPILGQQTQFTVLNVLGGGLIGGRYIPDSLGVGPKKIEYYKDNDLTIGCCINVYGREIILINCDEYTKEYYRKKYGFEDFTPLQKPTVYGEHHDQAIMADDRILSVFNGWGTHEDSEGNCKTVEPKPPQIDFNKFIKLDGYLLRFGAKMISKIKENMERIFIITYYLSNDTISVYELTVRNSGFKKGDFFKRSKFYLPNQEWFTSERPKLYTSQYFFIGSTIQLNDFKFYIVTADEFCLNYMENNSFEYSKSNIELIMNKIRNALQSQYKDFIGKYLDKLIINDNILVICHDTLRDALIELLGDNITEHEIITLIRYFSIDNNVNDTKLRCNRETVRSVVHLELLRNLWDDTQRFKEHLMHLNPYKQEYMCEKQLHLAILACRLPIKPILIKNMFAVLIKNADGDIELRDLFNFINLNDYKSAPIQPLNLDTQVCAGSIPFQLKDNLVNWNKFIDKIGLEEQLIQQTD